MLIKKYFNDRGISCLAYKKGAVPVAGTTKISQIDGMVKSVEAELTEEEIKYLEEPYIPHKLVGVMAQNLK